MKPIYLDYNATTPIDPLVYEAMLPFLKEEFGNPSSTHAYGKFAQRAVEKAREQVAEILGAKAKEVFFTGGGSEASNHVIKGIFWKYHPQPVHVIISSIEHPATYAPCESLKRFGCEVTVVPVDSTGWIDPDSIRQAIRSHTRLISIMHSNNEVGTIQPIAEIGTIARQAGVLFHTDVAQSVGKVPLDVEELQVDFVSIAGHKLYAPKGIGALYVRRGVELPRFIDGAGQEQGQRAGTENVPYIVGLGKAAQIAQLAFPESTTQLQQLRDRLHHHLQQVLGNRLVLNGHPVMRLPNTLNVSFLGHIGSEILEAVPQIAASTGSACHEGKITESPILKAMGLSSEVARGAVRLTVGRFSNQQQIDQAAELLIQTTK